MTIELKGNWDVGLAVDLHTVDSTYLGVDEYGHDHFDNVRSEIGELVYRLKYNGDASATKKIVDILEGLGEILVVEAIIPMPSTNKNRAVQPVPEIAQELGTRLNIPVLGDLLKKKEGGEELKNVEGPEERKKLLEANLYFEDTADIEDKKVLLLDDLYRSGATLSVATDLLRKEGKAKNVFALTMTKTRSRR